jgi:sulfur relay (sulfurtransferase) DsrF/TusC family protein
MSRRVVSLLRRGPAGLRASDPVLEANAYALAVDVDLAVVLMEAGVELAVEGGVSAPKGLAGAVLPPSAGGQDLRGLVESGVEVYASADAVARRGLDAEDLIPGVRLADPQRLDALLAGAEAVLNW